MKLTTFIALLSVLLLAGCTSENSKTSELLETARFEEKQNNYEHARKLYTEIVSTYPASHAAKEAAARLDVLKSKKP